MTEDRWAAYKATKSTRPAWANALIVAALLAVAGVVMTFVAGGSGPLFFVAAGVAAVIAGVLALSGVGRRA